MKIRELLDLVESDAPDPEKRIEKVFEWRHARMLELAKWALGASAAIAAALVASMLKDELKVGRAGQLILLGLLVFFLATGFVTLLRGSRLQQEYTAALSLLARLTPMRGIIQRYRQSGSLRHRFADDKDVAKQALRIGDQIMTEDVPDETAVTAPKAAKQHTTKVTS